MAAILSGSLSLQTMPAQAHGLFGLDTLAAVGVTGAAAVVCVKKMGSVIWRSWRTRQSCIAWLVGAAVADIVVTTIVKGPKGLTPQWELAKHQLTPAIDLLGEQKVRLAFEAAHQGAPADEVAKILAADAADDSDFPDDEPRD